MSNRWTTYSKFAFNALRSNIDLYPDDSNAKRAAGRIFYDLIFSSGTVKTGLISKEAMKLKKPCEDHYLSPQFVCRMICESPELYLEDYLIFENLFFQCRRTIMVTSQQNTALSKLTKNNRGNFQVFVPTNLKYEHLGIKLFERQGRLWSDSVELDSSVLDHYVPSDLLEFEKQFLVNE